jgi:hypothetical protein
MGSICLAATDYPGLGPPVEREAAKEVQQDKEGWGKRLDKLLGEIKEQRNLNLKLGFGFLGDEAGSSNLYKVAAELDMAKGVYPRRLAFRMGTDVTYKNSKLDEQVRSILANYDYHVLPELETYGFVERFTDTFMGVDDRYEIGGGLKFEHEQPGLTNRGKELHDSFKALQNPDTLTAVVRLLGESFRSQLGDLRSDSAVDVGITKRHAKFAVGVAGTVMIELEDASVETVVDTLDPTGSFVVGLGGAVSKIEVPSETQVRAVVRPSLTYRPTSELMFEARVYVKYPLRDARRDGELDYRVDGVARASLDLLPDRTGQEKVTLVWEIRENYDNTPPRIDETTLQAAQQNGLRFRETSNQRKHLATLFKLQVAL